MALTYPPGPRQYLPWQNFISFQRDPLSFLTEMAQKYGDIVHFRLGPRHIYFLNHPDHIKDVLITQADHFEKGQSTQQFKRLLGQGLATSEGAFHLKQRRLIQPIFHRKRIADYGKVMVAYSERFSQKWQNGQTVDMLEEMSHLALEIVGKTLFDTEISADTNTIVKAIKLFFDDFWLVLVPFIDQLEKLPIPLFRRTKQAREQLDAIIYRFIAEHRARGDCGDLLSMLLAVQDSEGDGLYMDDKQIRDEALIIFLAGHETTANALAWTWYLLAQHPTILAQLQTELDQVLAGRLPTMDDLPQLTYTRMVFMETMRLYPSTWILGRKVIEPYTIGDYVCPPNSTIMLSQWVMHHDSRYYDNPEQFDPTRWTPEAVASRPKFAYFPFGSGPRMCIGEQFAWMEAVLVIATLAQKWHMEFIPGQTIALDPLITLRPKHGLKFKLQQR